ncbi:MAG: porin, partial [Spirochaetia bacterium]
QIFGRQAWVGVNSDYGKLAFGRQYGEFSDAIGVGDVFGVNHGNQPYVSATNYGSNDAVNAFFLQESALRWDDSIKYDANFGGVTVGAMAYLSSISGSALPGAVNQNAMYSGSLGYNSKDFPVSAAVGVQWELDANQHNHYDVGGGVKWAFDSTDAVYAFYFYSQYDSGFARINANNSEFSSGLANGRTDNILGVAANYYVTQSLNLIAAYYLDYAQNVLNTIDNGTRNSILVVADYYFTKDFDTYLAASYSMFSGDLENTANGGDAFDANPANSITDVTSVVMGMRFRF